MKVYRYLRTILIESWIGFPDFRVDFVDFWISQWISGFLDFSLDFWISGFQFGFLPTVYEISFVTGPLAAEMAAVFIDLRSLARDAEYEILQSLVVEHTLLILCGTV